MKILLYIPAPMRYNTRIYNVRGEGSPMEYLKNRTELSKLYTDTPADGTIVTVCGWAKTVRDSKNIGFISLTDGSCYKPVQIVFEAARLENYAQIA